MKRIYLTIDTECHDIDYPDRHIWGRTSNGRYYGVKRILEVAKELQIRVNFFVDIAECKRYGIPFIKSITDMISDYGQSVYIHLHPNYITGDESRSYLWQYSAEEQISIFKEVKEYYQQLFPNKECVGFRIGRYGADKNMYDALEQTFGCGIIDFSYSAYSSKMCHIYQSEVGSFNKIVKYRNTYIFPNTRYKCFQLGNISKYLNLDTAESTFGEFRRILDENRMPFITLTMHSWNFIRKYFFIREHVWGDHSNLKKFYKMINYAKSKGYTFGDIASDAQLLQSTEYNDQTFDLCKGVWGKIRCIWYTFIRFQATARLTKKYFIFYCIVYIFCLIALLTILLSFA